MFNSLFLAIRFLILIFSDHKHVALENVALRHLSVANYSIALNCRGFFEFDITSRLRHDFYNFSHRWNDRFSIQKTSFLFMDLLRDLQSEIEQRGLTGAGKADTLALRSRFTYTPSGFRRLVRPSLTSLINQRKRSTLLPVCCRKVSGKGRKSPENSARKILNPMKSM